MSKTDEISNYITLSRRVFASPLWSDKGRPRTPFEAWLWLIKEARFEMGQQKLLLGGKLVTWGRGQLPGSVRYLADQWGWTLGKVQRFISRLEAEGMITKEVDNTSGQTIITLSNYDRYNHRYAKRYAKRYAETIDGKGFDVNDDTPNDTPGDTDPIHRRYETKKDKNGKKDNNKSLIYGASAPTHTQDDVDRFEKLKEWMSKKAPRVCKMEKPLTLNEFIALKRNYSNKEMADMFIKMHNWRPLLQKNVSTYLTFINWHGRKFANDDKSNNEQQPNIQNQKIKEAVRKARG